MVVVKSVVAVDWNGSLVAEFSLLGMFSEPLHLTVFQVIQRADDLHFALPASLTDGRAMPQEVLNRLPNIGFDRGRYQGLSVQIGMGLLSLLYGREDVVYQGGNAAMDYLAFGDSGHRPTMCVAQHDQQWRGQVVDSILDRADLIHIADVASHSDHKHIADALVEE